MARKLNVHQKIAKLEDKIRSLEKVVSPIIKEREAVEESKKKIIISCDASVSSTGSSTGVVIRRPNQDPYAFSQAIMAADSNEAELDAIYNGLTTFESMFANNSVNLPVIEIRSDSRHCIQLLTGKKKINSPVLQNKIEHIKSKVFKLQQIWLTDVVFVWKRRNSTFDLDWADDLSKQRAA